MLSVAVDEGYARTIDNAIAVSRLYSSRSEFLKDAIRKNLQNTLAFNRELKLIRSESEKLALKARQRGFSGKTLPRDERNKLAREFQARK